MALTQRTTKLTAEQFFALPDDGKQYELILGELREMTTPNIKHQRITFKLGRLLYPEVERIGGEVFCPGVGVVTAADVVLVPDLVVVTRSVQQHNLNYGLTTPPALVIEVLSPSTTRYDRTEKADRYADFGVPELWIVSPEAETIEVLVLREGRYAVHGRFGRDEPVSSTVLPGLSFPATTAFSA